MKSCAVKLSNPKLAHGMIETVEGLAAPDGSLHPDTARRALDTVDAEGRHRLRYPPVKNGD